ncbi:MAG: hypothetical protein CVU90_11860 [Firmicutes bacterium HGW-Firmicutes-15]|nr:MAG: hypothetical protein CVU90_11860 [Firmicutes bacterium HGW-Firmicutes-15]
MFFSSLKNIRPSFSLFLLILWCLDLIFVNDDLLGALPDGVMLSISGLIVLSYFVLARNFWIMSIAVLIVRLIRKVIDAILASSNPVDAINYIFSIPHTGYPSFLIFGWEWPVIKALVISTAAVFIYIKFSTFLHARSFRQSL